VKTNAIIRIVLFSIVAVLLCGILLAGISFNLFSLNRFSGSSENNVTQMEGPVASGESVTMGAVNAQKIKNLAYLQSTVTLEYDKGISPEDVQRIRDLFVQDSLCVEKKGKNGPTQQDIIPLIKKLEVIQPDDNTAELHALVCCQNPSLNPMLLMTAISTYLPDLTADHGSCKREEIYDINNHLFR